MLPILNENGIENLKCGSCWALYIVILNCTSSIKTGLKILSFIVEMFNESINWVW